MTFTDDGANIHTLTSFATGTVQAQTSVSAGKVELSLGATAYVVSEGDSIQIPVTLAEAVEEGRVYIPFTVTPASGTSESDFRAWSTFARQMRFNQGESTDWINLIDDDIPEVEVSFAQSN